MSQSNRQRHAGSDPGDLAARHLSIVAGVARDVMRTLPRSVSLDDLVGAGNLGLVEAARRFDPSKGASFATFARHRVRGAMKDGLRAMDTVSRTMRADQKRADLATSSLTQTLAGRPSEAEVAARLGMPVGRWRKLRLELHAAGCPADGPPRETAARVSTDSVPGTLLDPEAHAALVESQELIRTALALLPARQREVIRLHDFGGWTLRRIAVRLGVNESRVSQIRSEALRHLRSDLVSRGLESFE